jgi:hypothetical protein
MPKKVLTRLNKILNLPTNEIVKSNEYPLKVKLKTENIDSFPYMDSLYIWNKWGNTFSTSRRGSFMKFYVLKYTHGAHGSAGLKIFGIRVKDTW